MKRVSMFFSILLCMMYITLTATSQTTQQQKKERKKMIRNCSKTKNPYIRVNYRTSITNEEFINFADSICYCLCFREGDSTLTNIGVDNSKGWIEVITVQYKDSVDAANRRFHVRAFRENEFHCLLDNSNPLILFGNMEISKKEFFELPEDTIAFINFYLTDFVKKHYAPKGQNGIVYVCPRERHPQLKYTLNLPIPSEGRNYKEGIGISPMPHFKKDAPTSHLCYIKENQELYALPYMEGTDAIIILSCVVYTDGRIEPFLVEGIETTEDLSPQQKDSLITASENLIRSMPLWEDPGWGDIYDYGKKEHLVDLREFAISIPIHWKKNTENKTKGE